MCVRERNCTVCAQESLQHVNTFIFMNPFVSLTFDSFISYIHFKPVTCKNNRERREIFELGHRIFKRIPQ